MVRLKYSTLDSCNYMKMPRIFPVVLSVSVLCMSGKTSFNVRRINMDKCLTNSTFTKFISSSGAIRGKLNFNKYNKRRNIFFWEKLVTRRFVRYIVRTSSGKNNTQCTTYLKAKHN